MTPNDQADPVVIGETILALKNAIAPRGSVRERMLRAVTRPTLRAIRRWRLARLARNRTLHPIATVIRWRGLAERAAELPARPRMVILMLGHIGDFVLSMPALSQLRTDFPGSHLTLVCASWNQPWAERTGWFETVIPFDFFPSQKFRWTGPAEAQFAAFAALPIGAADLAVDLRHDPDTRPLLGLIEAGFRVGFQAPHDRGGAALDLALPEAEPLTSKPATGQSLHAELRLMLLAKAVARVFTPVPSHPARQLTLGRTKAPTSRPFAIIAPGAGAPISCWPLPRLIEIARRVLAQHDLDVVISGGPNEAPAAAQIVEALQDERVHDLCGRRALADLPDLLATCALYIGYDTGTTHLAAALGVPTVAILSGVPRIEVWHPTGAHVSVVAGRTSCSPCYLVLPEQCPYGVTCFDAVTVADVWQACEEQLGPARAKTGATSLALG